MSPWLWQQDDLILSLYVQPKASRDQIIGRHGNEIKVAITAPPIDGKANSHLIKFIAKAFKVTKANIEILRGQQGRHKQIKIVSPKLIPAPISTIINKNN